MSGFLDRVYEARDATEARDLYDDWARTYEAEVDSHGYATPSRCADALRMHAPDTGIPVLDFACGTGLSGVALKGAGFSTIDGIDISERMLERARAKGVYRDLSVVAPDDGDPRAPVAEPGAYGAIAAIGAIGSGAAPISAFDRIARSLAAGGLMVFSFNDHALSEPEYPGRVNAAIEDGEVRELFSEYGDHLPGLDMRSRVYVLEILRAPDAG